MRKLILGSRLAAAGLLVLIGATSPQAKTITNCVGSTSTCTFEGATFYAEAPVCPGGSCASHATADNCPGRCVKPPFGFCVNDGQCAGSGNSCEDTGTIPLCIAGSPNAGAGCFTSGDCNIPAGGSCNVGGVPCCSGSGGPAFVGDGKVTILGSNSADTITLGTPPGGTQYLVCGRNGNDTITGGNGDDLIDGGANNDTIKGENGTDRIYGGDGDDTIDVAAAPLFAGGDDFADGGDGNDTIGGSNRFLGSGGDNLLFGGNGDDVIVSGSGRDVVHGGPGVDGLVNVPAGTGTIPDDVVGTLICGDDDDDYLYAAGPAHQCMDGGAGNDQCDYDTRLASPTAKDVGTTVNCETVTGSVLAREPFCGCE